MPYPAIGTQNLDLSFQSSFRRSEAGKEIELSPPSGFAMMPQGNLVVADDFNHRIQIYDFEQNVKTYFGKKGKDNGQFIYPRGIDVDSEGNIYVADSWNHRVQKFTPEGSHLLTFGGYGEEKGQLNEPYDILVLPSGEIIVLERYNHRVQFFDTRGNSLGWIGARGTALEDHLAQIYETPPHIFPRPVFEFPTSITRDSQGNFFIADSGNHRIIKFDTQWNLIRTIGEKGSESGQFQYPLCVSSGPNDLLYIADLNNNRIQVFTSQGQFLTMISDGDKKIQTPCLTLVDGKGRLYVGLTFSPVISVFQSPVQPLDFFYNILSEANPDDLPTFCHKASFYQEKGYEELAKEALTKAVSILTTKNGQDFSNPSSCFEEPINLPLHFCRMVSKQSMEKNSEFLLLKCVDYFDNYIQAVCLTIIEHKKIWDEKASIFFHELIREEGLILNQKEDPLAFNKTLYQAEKMDKSLFREIRALFYVYRKICEQKAEFSLALLNNDLSTSGLKKYIESIKTRYQIVCDHINTLLENKENNEIKMIQALSEMENSDDKWESFRSKSMLNIRIMDSIKHFLFELRTIFKTIKGVALKFKTPWMKDCLSELFIKPPFSSLAPAILLRIQEDWDLHPFLETQYKEILDIWLIMAQSEKETHHLVEAFFSPVPFDAENINPEEIIHTLMVEGTPLEKNKKGLACGNKIYLLDFFEYNFDILCNQMQAVLDNTTVYEQKTRETFNELESFYLQKADLSFKLKRVNPRDKKEPIPLQNNILVVDFQISLLKRMVKALELNETNNFAKLIIGSALMATSLENRNHESAKNLFTALQSYRSNLEEKIKDASIQMKSTSLEKGALEKRLREELFKHDIGTIDQSLKTKERILKVQIVWERLSNSLTRNFKSKNFLDKLFDLLSLEQEPSSANGGFSMRFKFTFGGLGMDSGHFLYPLGVTHNPEGDILVADHNKHQIQKFSHDGFYHSCFGWIGSAPGALNSPSEVKTDSQGNIYVTDQINHRVQKFTPDGKFLLTFGDCGKAENSLGEIYSLSIDAENNIWVADAQNHRIALFSSQGEYIRSIGKKGKGPEELFEPVSICCIENGDYLVGDRSEHILKHFNSKGQLVHIFKKDLPSIDILYFLIVDPHYGIFVAEPMNKRILRLNSKLEPVFTYHRPGNRAGEFSTIAGLSIHKNTLLVTDSGNHRVQAFELSLE